MVWIKFCYFYSCFFKEIKFNKEVKKCNKELKEIKKGKGFPSYLELIINCQENNFEETGEYLYNIKLNKFSLGYVLKDNKIEDFRYKLNSQFILFRDVITFWKGEFLYIDQRKFDDYYIVDQMNFGVINFNVEETNGIYIIESNSKHFYILDSKYFDEIDNCNIDFICIFTI